MNNLLSLTRDGVEMIDYPQELRQHVNYAAKTWEEFTGLPETVKRLFAARDLQSGIGYEKKGNGERQSKDIKENFDITKASLADILAVSDDETATRFAGAATTLFARLEQMIITYGNHVEAVYDIPGFASEAAASASSAFVRFLRYPAVAHGTVIGEPHIDHSGFTFHLYESTDGCERLAFDGKTWLPMPVEEGQAAAFASMQTQLFSGGEIKGLCHRIIANDTTARLGRTAIVCFVPLVNTPSYDRATHGRLQAMEPGFNYTINQSTFNNLFRRSS